MTGREYKEGEIEVKKGKEAGVNGKGYRKLEDVKVKKSSGDVWRWM